MCVCQFGLGKGQSCGEHMDPDVLLNSAKTDAVPGPTQDTARLNLPETILQQGECWISSPK